VLFQIIFIINPTPCRLLSLLTIRHLLSGILKYSFESVDDGFYRNRSLNKIDHQFNLITRFTMNEGSIFILKIFTI